MKTAVIYARYSCDKQTEQSIEGQLRVCEEFAKKNKILILDTYIDQAISGTTDNRASFQRMIKDSSRKEWDYVIVYKLDRFSRDKYATAIHKKTLRDNGTKVLSAMENIPDTPEGIILESLLEGMNQYYSAELSQKVKRGMKETRLKGLYQGGGIPYGYALDGRKLIVDENRAENVRYMFTQFSIGVYVKDIIAELTLRGVTYRGKPLARNTVYNILRNEKYIGVYHYGDELIENMYPQIVSVELFDKVRKIIDSNKIGSRSAATVYLLRHKITCGYCGRRINGESGTSKMGYTKAYYKCSGRKERYNDCQKSTISKEVLEKFVLDATIKELSAPENMDKTIKSILLQQENALKHNNTLEALLREKTQVETSLENIISAVERGIVSNTTNKRLHELENRQEHIEQQILIEKSKTIRQINEKDIRLYFEHALRLQPLALINFLIKEIILYDDKIVIQYNSPIKNSSDENQSFSFIKQTVKLWKDDIITIELFI